MEPVLEFNMSTMHDGKALQEAMPHASEHKCRRRRVPPAGIRDKRAKSGVDLRSGIMLVGRTRSSPASSGDMATCTKQMVFGRTHLIELECHQIRPRLERNKSELLLGRLRDLRED